MARTAFPEQWTATEFILADLFDRLTAAHFEEGADPYPRPGVVQQVRQRKKREKDAGWAEMARQEMEYRRRQAEGR